ncbi:MAG TPA: hypothetical protein VGE98_07710, partial [Thermoanaerobaculia bacterium]
LTWALTLLSVELVAAAGGSQELPAKLAAGPLHMAAMGGLPTLVPAPAWGVALVDVGIVALSVAMAAARRGGVDRRAFGHWAVRIVALAVALSGAGVVAGLCALFEVLAFGRWQLPAALGLAGGAAFAACLALQGKRLRRRAPMAGVLFAASCLLIPLMMSGLRSAPVAFVAAVLGVHVLLQGTFFALAYLIGERLGGAWFGALVSAVEGAAGYTGFLLATHAVR